MFVGVMWGLTFGNWTAKKIKSKDVGVSWISPRMNGA